IEIILRPAPARRKHRRSPPGERGLKWLRRPDNVSHPRRRSPPGDGNNRGISPGRNKKAASSPSFRAGEAAFTWRWGDAVQTDLGLNLKFGMADAGCCAGHATVNAARRMSSPEKKHRKDLGLFRPWARLNVFTGEKHRKDLGLF
ncbi:MAG: hypothetical protein RSB18_09795, partial [Clostridia bacterium]